MLIDAMALPLALGAQDGVSGWVIGTIRVLAALQPRNV